MVNNTKIMQLTKRVEEIRMACIGDGTALINAYRWDPQRDLRITSNKRLTRLLIGLNVSFVYLSNSDPEEILEGIRMPFEKDVDINQYLLINEVFLKTGFISSLFSVVESVLRDYLHFLDEDAYKASPGIIPICKCLLVDKLEWDRVNIDCSALDFLRLLRNSLHNNAVHLPLKKSEKNVSIQYKGQQYQFSEGKRLDFVSWDLLLDLADDMRSLVFHLAHDKAISSISRLIQDTNAI